jgi:quinol monooxygenase YgiN
MTDHRRLIRVSRAREPALTMMRKDASLSTEVFWQLRAAVKPGKADELRALMGELVESTTEEPGTQLYEWFADDGDTEVHIFEHYLDSPAALAHCATFGERYAERFWYAST